MFKSFDQDVDRDDVTGITKNLDCESDQSYLHGRDLLVSSELGPDNQTPQEVMDSLISWEKIGDQ